MVGSIRPQISQASEESEWQQNPESANGTCSGLSRETRKGPITAAAPIGAGAWRRLHFPHTATAPKATSHLTVSLAKVLAQWGECNFTRAPFFLGWGVGGEARG